MTALIVVGSLVAYTVIGAAVWERTHVPGPSGLELHKVRCGQEYRGLEHCAQHSDGRLDCEGCWLVSYEKCIGHPCNVKAARDWLRNAAIGALWLPLIPVWIGTRIGRKKRVGGFRLRKAERLAKHIADLEKEVFGG